MRESLESRLKRLEALPRPEQPAQPAPLTSDDVQRWAYYAFCRNELHVVDGVVNVNRWTAREHEYAALGGIARVINEWRSANGNEPFLPIMPDDGHEALALLRAGNLQARSDGRVSQEYRLACEFSHEYARIADALNGALRVFIASGGGDGQPYQPGEIEELLAAFVEHAEANQE